jgi:hypothetical protein
MSEESSPPGPSQYVCSMSSAVWTELRDTVGRSRRVAHGTATGVALAAMICCGIALFALMDLPSTDALLITAGAGLVAYPCAYVLVDRVGSSRALAALRQDLSSVLSFDPPSEDAARLVRSSGAIIGKYRLSTRSEDGTVSVWAEDLDTVEYRRHWSWLGSGGG